MPLSFVKRLKKIEKQWKHAEGEQGTGFKNPPDGKHKAVLFGATIGESSSKENPRLQVTWDFRIIKGRAINQHARAWDSLEDDRGLANIKGRLKVMGQKIPKSPIHLPEALDNATETKCLIKLVTRPGTTFQNLTVLKRLSSTAATKTATAGLKEEEE